MCGRYFFHFNSSKISKEIKKKAETYKVKFAEDEIFPGNHVLAIIKKEEKLLITSLK